MLTARSVAAFLDQVCGNNKPLRQEVESLLAAAVAPEISWTPEQ
jgi:hypothetical protein